MRRRSRRIRQPGRKFQSFHRQPAARRVPASRRLWGIEWLEPRYLLAGGLLYPATGPGGLVLRLSGSDVQIADLGTPTTVLASKPLDEITDGVRIEGSAFDVNLTIDASLPPIPGGIVFAGGTGTNTLTGPNVSTDWIIDVPDGGAFGGRNTFSSVERLVGGTSDDNFRIESAGSISGCLDGGGGTNSLDYSAYANSIIVDLSGGTAIKRSCSPTASVISSSYADSRCIICDDQCAIGLGPSPAKSLSTRNP